MPRDLIVALDGSPADEFRIAAVDGLSALFGARITALVLNFLPDPIVPILPLEAAGIDADLQFTLHEQARQAGDLLERAIAGRLASLPTPIETRRFDLSRAAAVDTIVSQARTSDVFVTVRPGLADNENEWRMVEGVLLGSGRHLFLGTGKAPPQQGFDHALVAWNGSREAARAMAEAMPYLHKSRTVTIAVKADDSAAPEVVSGAQAVRHLSHHGVEAVLLQLGESAGSVSSQLIETARELRADLMVAGGYSHSRLVERLFGGVTRDLLHDAPVSLVVAH